MTDFPWLSQYPSDVPHLMPELERNTLPGMIRLASEKYSKQIAFTQVMPNGMNGSLSYKRVDELSDNFACYLRETLKLVPGDRVAVQMPNCLSYPIVAFGIMKAGLILVNTNPLYTATELRFQLKDSGAKALVVIDMFADRLPEGIDGTAVEHIVTVAISEHFPSVVHGVIRLVQKVWSRTLPKITVNHTPIRKALVAGATAKNSDRLASYTANLTENTTAALQYTGGTTGVSKGAMLSHGNLTSNTVQMVSMCGSYMRPGVETVLTALPLYHVFAFTVNLLAFYHIGARNILVPSPRPPSNLKRAFENYRITWLTGVNTLFNALLNERWFVDSPPKRLRGSAAGGMALHHSVSERWRALTGSPIVEGYGLTESAPVLTFNPLGGVQKDGSIGIPVPSTEVRLVSEDGSLVGPGEPGELQAKGPQIMQGYWNQPDQTAQTLRDGWLSTGDIATMDVDGYLSIVDRKKDMVLVSGFNVYPNEIEETIAALPEVIEVGVIGLPDERSGERVHAYVVAKPGLNSDQVLEHCRKTLAAYKVPAQVHFVEQLPKSPIGKILRRELRTQMAASQSKGA